MAKQILVAPAPHVHGTQSTQRIMRDVLLALLPALVVSVVMFEELLPPPPPPPEETV